MSQCINFNTGTVKPLVVATSNPSVCPAKLVDLLSCSGYGGCNGIVRYLHTLAVSGPTISTLNCVQGPSRLERQHQVSVEYMSVSLACCGAEASAAEACLALARLCNSRKVGVLCVTRNCCTTAIDYAMLLTTVDRHGRRVHLTSSGMSVTTYRRCVLNPGSGLVTFP